MSWPPDNTEDRGTWQTGPVDGPPDQAGPPIPPYSPPPPRPQPPPQPDARQGGWGPQPHTRPGGWVQQPQPGSWTPEDTAPGPSFAARQQPQLRYASWGERVGATLIDAVFVMLVSVLFTFITFGLLDNLGGLVAVALWGYIAWLNGSKGQSPGKALTGLKLVRDVDGTTLGGPVGLVRTLSLWVIGMFSIGLLWVLALLWPAWDARRQALHDKLFGAVVIAGHPQARFGKDIFRP